MRLTTEQHRSVARRACFYFDCYFGQGTADSCIHTGDGVDDLDRLISLIANGTQLKAKFTCDVGGVYSDYRPFDLEDLQAIREQYVVFYGNVNKPDAYESRPAVYCEV